MLAHYPNFQNKKRGPVFVMLGLGSIPVAGDKEPAAQFTYSSYPSTISTSFSLPLLCWNWLEDLWHGLYEFVHCAQFVFVNYCLINTFN